MSQIGRVWWEKTVEYLFVSLFPALAEGFIAPLDGDQERAGDAIFSHSDRWLLLEFKKDQSCLRREREKYTNYDEAAQALRDSDSHHLLVYGYLKADESLGLSVITYFSQADLAFTDDVLASACTPGEFWKYIEKIRGFKKQTGSQSESSAEGLGALDYSMVMGVSKDGQATGCTTVSEFQKSYKKSMDRVLGLEHSRGFSRPTLVIPPAPPQKPIDRGGRGR